MVSSLLTHRVLVWGVRFENTIQPILIIQKKAIGTITRSKFDKHSSPLFKLQI